MGAPVRRGGGGPRAAVPLGPEFLSAVPTVTELAAACTVPTCLGFWKSGYAVSYGYGSAVALTALLYPPTTGLARAHGWALAFYGLRLNAFLLYRNLFLPESVPLGLGTDLLSSRCRE